MRVLVGFDGSEGAHDAVALARVFGAGDWDEVRLETVAPDADPALALADLAADEAFDLLVVGSPHRGTVGRALIGSVAEGILHRAATPTVVAPRGYARAAHSGFDVVGVAYDGSAESKLALAYAQGLAAKANARIRVLNVEEPMAVVPGVVGYTPPPPTDPGELIEEALAAIGTKSRGEGRCLAGPTAASLAAACEDGVDILIAGSRGSGPLGRVLLGSVSTQLIHKAPCPVLVVPRGEARRAVPLRFADRREAGGLLAERLANVADPAIVALPRGGVPVGAEIAAALEAPLEILMVRKLGAPGNPEYGVGAIAEDGTRVVDPEATAVLGIRNGELDSIVAYERKELRRRVQAYRGDRPPADLRGRTVVIVDDGAATGLTDVAAIQAVRRQEPRRVIVALPVCSPEALEILRGEADQVICLRAPRPFFGVGQWYRDFSQVSDQEVIDALRGPARAAA